jgi:uncharacterized membrane protein YdbT with pleckstrin-like domain
LWIVEVRILSVALRAGAVFDIIGVAVVAIANTAGVFGTHATGATETAITNDSLAFFARAVTRQHP